MPGSITWDAPTRFEIALDGLTATLWLAEGDNRWRVSYAVDGRHGGVDIGPGRMPWATALRRALGDCLMHLAAAE
jgi:hypothetical protein